LIELTLGDDDALPDRFRLFVAGENETTKGTFLFDEAAAASVLAAFERGGVDLAIDLAHDSLDPAARAMRNDADDAMGWFRLEVDADGSLWAVGVKWTEPGATRLRKRLQRYVSPAFLVGDENRIVEILNCAICSQPATFNTPALVAAARDVRLRADVSFNAILEAVTVALRERHPPGDSGPYAHACDVYDSWLVYELAGQLYRVDYAFVDGAATLGVNAVRVERTYAPIEAIEMNRLQTVIKAFRESGDAAKFEADLVALEMSPADAKAAVDAVKGQDGAAALALVESMLVAALGAGDMAPTEDEAPAEDDALADAPVDDEAPAEDDEAEAMTAAALTRLVPGARSATEAEAELARKLAAYDRLVALEAEREAAERRELVGELVKIGAELPATAWDGEPQNRKPAAHLAALTVAALRERVRLFTAARPGVVRAPDASDDEITDADRRATEGMNAEQKARYFRLRRSTRRKGSDK